MIAKLARRAILSNTKFIVPNSICVTRPQYHFSKLQKISHLKKILEDQIKQEQSNPQNVSQYENKFKNAGWTLSKQNLLVELSKTVGDYQVRLVSQIRSPSNFQDQHEHSQQSPQHQHEEPEVEMAQVSIYINKKAVQKTLVVDTIVTTGFEITGMSFAQNYNLARNNRFHLQNNNQYTGPDIQTLPDTVFESVYGFLEETLQIDNELLNQLADYCLDSEQEFYLNWLKDIRSLL